MTKRVIAALALLLALTAGGCPAQKGCTPGDKRSAHGHTETCGPDKKWHF